MNVAVDSALRVVLLQPCSHLLHDSELLFGRDVRVTNTEVEIPAKVWHEFLRWIEHGGLNPLIIRLPGILLVEMPDGHGLVGLLFDGFQDPGLSLKGCPQKIDLVNVILTVDFLL